MSLTLSSYFRSKMESTMVNSILRSFTFNGSMMDGTITKWPTIARNITDMVGGVMVIEVENARQIYNDLMVNRTQLGAKGYFDYGYGGLIAYYEIMQFFGGILVDINLVDTLVTLTFGDLMAEFGTRFVGTQNSPISFTSSNYNPADLAWSIVTSYGGLNAVKSTSNPDINYQHWSDWWSGFNTDSIVVQGYFNGQKVIDVLNNIAKVTDSVIFVEGNNTLDFARWTGASPGLITMTDSHITIDPIEANLSMTQLVNKGIALMGYNPSSGTWSGQITYQNTASVNSYGTYPLTYDDTSVWYVNSLSALNFIQRIVFRRNQPNLTMKVKTPMRFLDATIGDVVALTTQVYSLSAHSFIINGYEQNFDEHTIVFDLDEGFGRAAGALRGFTLDDAKYGLLDQTYNGLY